MLYCYKEIFILRYKKSANEIFFYESDGLVVNFVAPTSETMRVSIRVGALTRHRY